MKTYQIATIPGDGIGKEVVPAGHMQVPALCVPLFAWQIRGSHKPCVSSVH